jgi:hypothetical protein
MKKIPILVAVLSVVFVSACGDDLSKIQASQFIDCNEAVSIAQGVIMLKDMQTGEYKLTPKSAKSPEAYAVIHKAELIAIKFEEEFGKWYDEEQKRQDTPQLDNGLVKKWRADQKEKIKQHVLSICTEYPRLANKP